MSYGDTFLSVSRRAQLGQAAPLVPEPVREALLVAVTSSLVDRWPLELPRHVARELRERGYGIVRLDEAA